MKLLITLFLLSISSLSFGSCQDLTFTYQESIDSRDSSSDFSKCTKTELKTLEKNLSANINYYQKVLKKAISTYPRTPEDLSLINIFSNKKATLALIKIELLSRK